MIARCNSAVKIERAMRRAEKVQAKRLEVDTAEIDRDARAAGGG